MKKLILLLVGCFITLVSFAQPSFYRAYSKVFGEVDRNGDIVWEQPEDSHTLIKVEDAYLTIYANETTVIYITKELTEDKEVALVYEAVDDDGGDCTLFLSKTEQGNTYIMLKYTFAVVLFFIEKEQ